MKFNIFLSTAITGINEEEKQKLYTLADRAVRMECEAIREDDEIVIFDNFSEPPAPPNTLHKKLHHLEKAFSKMKNCHFFCLITEPNLDIKPNCMVELNAWLTSGGNQPIIRSKPEMRT